MKVTLFVVLMVVALVHCKTLVHKEEMRRADKMQKRAEASSKQQRDLETRSWNVYVIKMIMKFLQNNPALLAKFQSLYNIDPSYFYSYYGSTTPYSSPSSSEYSTFNYQNLSPSFIPPSWRQPTGKIVPPFPSSGGGPPCSSSDPDCFPTTPPCSSIFDPGCWPTSPPCSSSDPDCFPTTPPCSSIFDPGCWPTSPPCSSIDDPNCWPTTPPCSSIDDPNCFPTGPTCNPITDPTCIPTCIPFIDPGCPFPSS